MLILILTFKVRITTIISRKRRWLNISDLLDWPAGEFRRPFGFIRQEMNKAFTVRRARGRGFPGVWIHPAVGNRRAPP